MENLNHDELYNKLYNKLKNHNYCSVQKVCGYLEEYQWYLWDKKKIEPRYRFDDAYNTVTYFEDDGTSWIVCGMDSWDRPVVLKILLDIYYGITPDFEGA